MMDKIYNVDQWVTDMDDYKMKCTDVLKIIAVILWWVVIFAYVV